MKKKKKRKKKKKVNISPILNMAVPVPAFDMINIDPSKMLGISKCHLQTFEEKNTIIHQPKHDVQY